jgi:hypothetical protein
MKYCFFCGAPADAQSRVPFNAPDGGTGYADACAECGRAIKPELDPETGEWTIDLSNNKQTPGV